MGFTATDLVKEFGIKGSNGAHKVKLLAMEWNPTIPGLEIKSKPKSTKKRLAGSTLSMPVPPNKKKLAKIDASLVESGQLKIGIPCVPVSMKRRIKGEIRVIEAQSRKFSFADIRQSILNCHEQFMRLHTDDRISAMGEDEVLSLLNDHPMVSCDCDLSAAPLEELQARLTHYERNRMLWVWHDHSSLFSHGILALMVGVLYDPIVFFSESESPSIQEYVEEGEIHIVAHGSSSLSDQAYIIPERLAELDGLCEAVTTKNGIRIMDTLKFFKGGKPAAQFEAGISCGEHFPCVGCVCSASRFSDFAHASYCDQRTFESIQKVALDWKVYMVKDKVT